MSHRCNDFPGTYSKCKLLLWSSSWHWEISNLLGRFKLIEALKKKRASSREIWLEQSHFHPLTLHRAFSSQLVRKLSKISASSRSTGHIVYPVDVQESLSTSRYKFGNSLPDILSHVYTFTYPLDSRIGGILLRVCMCVRLHALDAFRTNSPKVQVSKEASNETNSPEFLVNVVCGRNLFYLETSRKIGSLWSLSKTRSGFYQRIPLWEEEMLLSKKERRTFAWESIFSTISHDRPYSLISLQPKKTLLAAMNM